MRPVRLAAFLASVALAAFPLSRAGALAAQATERTDTPGRGSVRVTFDPSITTWERVFTGSGEASLGAPLSGDTIGATYIPAVARLQQDVRTASGDPGFIATLGSGTLSVHQEARVTPIVAELGLTDRVSLSVRLPIVRIATSAALRLSPAGANLGPNPLATTSGAAQQYAAFFTQFDAALAQLADSVAQNHYGCPMSPECQQAEALLSRGQAVRNALERTVYGVSATPSPFLPRAGSAAGAGIDSAVAGLQRQLDTTYHVTGFTDGFLLAADSLTEPTFEEILSDSALGFGYYPFRSTWRYGLGDMELEAKYRVVSGGHYAAAVAGLVRLPTGTRDTALEVLDAPFADHQTDVEGRLIQELTVGSLWLNLSVRAGVQRPGTRAARVAPFGAFLVPFAATTELGWDPGDYLGVDVAPMYRLARRFAIGITAGYWSKRADHYRYLTAQDSLDLAGRLGVPIAASVLDQGTSQRWARLGVALTYVGPDVEGGFSVEQTVSGAGGMVPVATVYRLVLRVRRKLF